MNSKFTTLGPAYQNCPSDIQSLKGSVLIIGSHGNGQRLSGKPEPMA